MMSISSVSNELAQKTRTKLEEVIANGSAKAKTVIEGVMDTTVDDFLVSAKNIHFVENSNLKATVGGWNVDVQFDADGPQDLHRHALHQAAERVELPRKYLEHLRTKGEWGNKLIADNLNELYQHVDSRFLLRAVKGEVRGFLSDHYRPLDTAMLIESFATACQKVDAKPYEGYMMDTKVVLRAILPRVYEPIPNEIMAYGVTFEDSGFGNGPTQVTLFALRLVCLNGMVANRAIRQVHLGRQLPDNVEFARDTYRANSEALSLQVRDVVRGQLAEKSIDLMQDAIRTAHSEKLEPKAAQEFLKKHLAKGDTDRVVQAFNSPDVENLPAGNTKWRLSNALSWVAGQTEDTEKKLDFQRLAGQVVKVKDN
jgi:hypothetical protein